MTRYLRLPLSFDLDLLKQDLAKIREGEWIDHVNTAVYEGKWRAVPLRSVGGGSGSILSVDGADYLDTGILQRCSYFREVIDSFQCEKTSVRLMAMAPGSRILPHRDRGTSFEDGMARIHLPLVTSHEVLFTIDNEKVHFSAGNAWYLNAQCLHGVSNDGENPRVHLMLDCIVNPWLEKVILASGFRPAPKPKYGDRSINDGNVDDVIAALLQWGSEEGRSMAARLAALRDGS